MDKDIRADDWYFRELERQALSLSPEEQRKLLDRYRATGDPEARELLLRSVYRLIMRQARRFAAQEQLWDFTVDIAQQGVLGAMKALSKHDGRQSEKYSSYAVWWMRSYMGGLKHYQVNTIHIPVMRAIAEQRALAEGTTPPMLLPRTVSLSEPIATSRTSHITKTVEDTIGVSDDQIERIAQREVRDDLTQFLKRRMSPDRMPVIVARFGLDGRGCRTNEEIARTRGTSKQAVHQMINRALYRYPQLRAINEAISWVLRPSTSQM